MCSIQLLGIRIHANYKILGIHGLKAINAMPIPLFLHDSLFFFKNRPRGFRYSIKDALAEIWKRFEVKSETR